MQKKEVWKTIEDAGGQYEISNYGRVRSKNSGRIKATTANQFGHYKVLLWHGNKSRMKYVHRLVYEAFIGDIPKGYDVHHIDGNRHNNMANNLKAISHSEHISKHMKGRKHTLGHKRSKKAIESQSAKVQKAVNQYSLDGKYITTFPSMRAAEKATGIDNSSISRCCNGKLKQSGGFKWKFKE